MLLGTLTTLGALAGQRWTMNQRLTDLWNEAERLQAAGVPPMELAAKLVEFRREQVLRDADDPSHTEHFTELKIVLTFLIAHPRPRAAQEPS
jgi:hypothetical protein